MRATSVPPSFGLLGSRQRDMIAIICASGGATTREIHAQLPDPPRSICGIRTQLNRMVKRGLLKVRPSGRHRELTYLPTIAGADLQLQAFRRIAEEHFGGSTKRAVQALLKLAANETVECSDLEKEAA